MVRLLALPVRTRHLSDRRRQHAGHSADVVDQLQVEALDAGLVVAVQCWVDAEGDEVVDVQAGVERLEVVETPREETRAGHQQHRQRDLRNDEALAKTGVVDAAGQIARFIAQRPVQFGLGRLQRRNHAEHQRRGQRQRRGE